VPRPLLGAGQNCDGHADTKPWMSAVRISCASLYVSMTVRACDGHALFGCQFSEIAIAASSISMIAPIWATTRYLRWGKASGSL
jgi:hypothetical protein